MKIQSYELYWRGQVGCWVCKCTFTVETGNQFTAERCTVTGDGRWGWVAFLSSRRQAKRHAAMLSRGAKKLRAEKGWR